MVILWPLAIALVAALLGFDVAAGIVWTSPGF